ncbi:MAG: endonuclease/exonuclease/phosphatase family protein [Limisphaerales bacterium]
MMYRLLAAALLLAATPLLRAAETVKVVTWNVENYLLEKTETRPAKSPESRAKIRGTLLALRPDVLALQEIGGRAALDELQAALKSGGLDLPYAEFVTGWDTNIQVAVLSRFPYTARRPHTNDAFLLQGRRFRVSRGFAEVEIGVRPDYRLTLLTAHLKSRRAVPEADEAEMRLEEAKLLRTKVDARLAADPQANVIVLGDFNDTKDQPPIRTLVGRGATALVDTRPAERNGDTGFTPNPRWQPRTITWTHYYGVEDSYSRIDYALISAGLAKEWRRDDTYVHTMSDWGVASDHRPLVITVEAADGR